MPPRFQGDFVLAKNPTGRQEVIIDPEGARQKAMKDVPKTTGTRTIIVGRGQFSVPLTRLESVTYIEQPDGSKKKFINSAPIIRFPNGIAEIDTSDDWGKKQLDALKKERGWKSEFFYHPNCLPTDASDEDKVLAAEIAEIGKEHLKEMQARIEAAKHFDKTAHPDEGVEDPINPATGKPDDIMEW